MNMDNKDMRENMESKEVDKTEEKKFEMMIPKKWIKTIIIGAVILLVGGGSAFAYKEYKEYKMEQAISKMALKQAVQTEENAQANDTNNSEVANKTEQNTENATQTNSQTTNKQASNTKSSNMGIEEVKKVIMSKYGNNVVFRKIELDYTDDYGLNNDNSKKAVYEIDFTVGNVKYEADVNAVTGEILKSKVD